MGIKEALAELTPQKRPWYKRIRVAECVLCVYLLLHSSPAAFAYELPVEGIELLRLWIEDIFVPLDRLPGEEGIHLSELHEGDTTWEP